MLKEEMKPIRVPAPRKHLRGDGAPSPIDESALRGLLPHRRRPPGSRSGARRSRQSRRPETSCHQSFSCCFVGRRSWNSFHLTYALLVRGCCGMTDQPRRRYAMAAGSGVRRFSGLGGVLESRAERRHRVRSASFRIRCRAASKNSGVQRRLPLSIFVSGKDPASCRAASALRDTQ